MTKPRITLQGHFSNLRKAHEDDAGFDISANDRHDLNENYPSEINFVKTGVYLEMPQTMAALILPRSGLAGKKGLWIPNSPGLIDPGYRGEVMVMVARIEPAPPGTSPQIYPGDRIAQLVFVNIWNGSPEIVESEAELTPTDRSSGGFGSTGE